MTDNDPAQRAEEMARKAEQLQAELAALQAETAALQEQTQAAPAAAPVVAAQQPASAPPQFSLQPTAPVKQKGRGGLIATLIVLSTALVASVAALALLFLGIVVSPFGAPATPATQVSGTPTTTYFAPANAAGANAFSSATITIAPDASLPATIEVAGAEASAAPVPTVGDTSGLYGLGPNGCTRDGLVNDLTTDSAKVSAWVGALNEDPTLGWGSEVVADDLKKYLYTLTSLTLVSDTWVIDHGYADGAVVATPLLLQKGTAVLVDLYGAPRVRCITGNPLTAPPSDAAPVYTGSAWEDYLPESVVSVEPAATATVQYQVRVPATLAGSPLPLLPYPCQTSDGCAAPSSAFVVPDLSVTPTLPAGVTVPVASICSELPPENEVQNVSGRIYNATAESRYQFWVSNSTYGCEAFYVGELKPYSATNGSPTAGRVGDAFLFTTGGDTGEGVLITNEQRVWTTQ